MARVDPDFKALQECFEEGFRSTLDPKILDHCFQEGSEVYLGQMALTDRFPGLTGIVATHWALKVGPCWFELDRKAKDQKTDMYLQDQKTDKEIQRFENGFDVTFPGHPPKPKDRKGRPKMDFETMEKKYREQSLTLVPKRLERDITLREVIAYSRQWISDHPVYHGLNMWGDNCQCYAGALCEFLVGSNELPMTSTQQAKVGVVGLGLVAGAIAIKKNWDQRDHVEARNAGTCYHCQKGLFRNKGCKRCGVFTCVECHTERHRRCK